MTALRRVLMGAFVLGLGFSITLSETALAGLTILWLWGLGDPGARSRALWPLAGPVLAFSSLTLVSALASGDVGSSLHACKGLLLVLALYVTADGLSDTDGADRFLSTLALVGAAAALMGLLQVAACPASAPASGLGRWFFHRCDRARGPFSIYMTLAGVLNLLALAIAPRLLPGSWRWWAFPPWLSMVLGLAATLVRGAWVGFVAGVLALVPMIRRGRLLLVLGLAVVAVLALLGPGPLRHRLQSMTDPEDPTVREREYMWRSAGTMWLEHNWLLGVGPGGVKRLYEGYALPGALKKRTSHVHNTPLQILVERGIAGLAAWLWIWVAFYVRAGGLLRRLPVEGRRERALVMGSLAAVSGFLVAGLSEYNFGDSEVVLVAWVVMALPFAVSRGTAAVTVAAGATAPAISRWRRARSTTAP